MRPTSSPWMKRRSRRCGASRARRCGWRPISSRAARRTPLFSAGHTGATFLAAHAAFGVLAGVERPALAVTIPTRTGAAILVDAGANLECRPSHLVQFGLMGAAYARVDLRLVEPKVGLLSIGEEAGQGQ